jgi:CHAT domain-containing protein
VQAALDAAIAAIRQTRADFLHPTLEYRQIAGAAGNKGQALVYLATTVQGTLALIIPGGVADVTDEHALFAPDLTTAALEKLAMHSDDEETVVKTQLGNLPRPNVLDEWLATLGTTLMAPLAARLHSLGVTNVALIPAGRLATLPLHAAPIGTAAPVRDDEAEEPTTTERDDALFLDAFDVTYAPSAQRLGMARAATAVVLRSGVAAVGNPQPASMALEWAEHEAEAIAQVASRASQSCTLLIRRKANAEAVTRALADRAYIHLACASAFYPDRPVESYLELAEGTMLKASDMLTGAVRLRGVRTVVLSAGQSAMSAANAPDESVGMALALLVGGAGGVAACLWPASDLATLLLMRRFAELYLSQDQKPAQALRNAQRWLRTLSLETLTREYGTDTARDPDLTLAEFALPGDTPFAHPFYWASFVYHGA